jgi:hypothetical protein
MDHIMHSSASRPKNVNTLLFKHWWDWYGFNKMRTGTCYTKLVFLNPVGYMVHVVHSDASREGNVKALFLMLGGLGVVSIKSVPGHFILNLVFFIQWDLWVTLCIPAYSGLEMSTHFFHTWVGPVRFP